MTTVMDVAYSRAYDAFYMFTPKRFCRQVFFAVTVIFLTDAKNYSRQGHKQVLQQGHNQVHARVPNQALIDKYENEHIDK